MSRTVLLAVKNCISAVQPTELSQIVTIWHTNQKHRGSKNWSSELFQTQPTIEAQALGSGTCAVRLISDWNLSVVTPVAVECSSSSSSPSRQDKTRVTEHLSYPQSVHVTCTSKDRAYVTCSQSDSRPSSLLGAFAKQLKKSSY